MLDLDGRLTDRHLRWERRLHVSRLRLVLHDTGRLLARAGPLLVDEAVDFTPRLRWLLLFLLYRLHSGDSLVGSMFLAIVDKIAVLFTHLLNDVDTKDDLAFAKAVREELLESD